MACLHSYPPCVSYNLYLFGENIYLFICCGKELESYLYLKAREAAYDRFAQTVESQTLDRFETGQYRKPTNTRTCGFLYLV